ncbi:phosphatidylserine decarboxylase [Fulvivirga sp. 29W222]|uniref:Phosphatidylserine decarboxylase n=1 Tax=Fulvivirga marina TaxID=2494733 RepID=A0A937KBH5_9BACT|nr:phosphatidylserine decarboxylase [Fulvivirga marina]MBL6445999.1 phosphatidylserine decarboxylase [Fulvivirga marina]
MKAMVNLWILKNHGMPTITKLHSPRIFWQAPLIPIGIQSVSSVNFEESVQVGVQVTKGDMLCYFLFGGSDCIIIFQDKAGFELEAPMNTSGDNYEHRLVRERLGYLGNSKEE